MSLRGVESARRRRASHGRSAAVEPHVRVAKPVAAIGGIAEGESSHSRAMAARHRLDEKLRAAAPCRSSCIKASSRSTAVSLAPATGAGAAPVVSLSTESGQRLHSAQGKRDQRREGCRPEFELREERMQETKSGVQEDCPVCLESFVSGQMVMYLPCHHRFHSTCLVPWLLSHCHCPFCRAHVANPHD